MRFPILKRKNSVTEDLPKPKDPEEVFNMLEGLLREQLKEISKVTIGYTEKTHVERVIMAWSVIGDLGLIPADYSLDATFRPHGKPSPIAICTKYRRRVVWFTRDRVIDHPTASSPQVISGDFGPVITVQRASICPNLWAAVVTRIAMAVLRMDDRPTLFVMRREYSVTDDALFCAAFIQDFPMHYVLDTASMVIECVYDEGQYNNVVVYIVDGVNRVSAFCLKE